MLKRVRQALDVEARPLVLDARPPAIVRMEQCQAAPLFRLHAVAVLDGVGHGLVQAQPGVYLLVLLEDVAVGPQRDQRILNDDAPRREAG